MRCFSLLIVLAVFPNTAESGWALGLLFYMDADPEVRDIIHRARRPLYDDNVRDTIIANGMRSLVEKASLEEASLLNARNIVALATNATDRVQDSILIEGLEALISYTQKTGGLLPTEEIISLAINAHSNDNHEAILLKAIEYRSLLEPDGQRRLAQAAHTNDKLRGKILLSFEKSPCQKIGIKLSQ